MRETDKTPKMKPSPPEKTTGIWEFFKTIITAVFIAVIIRTFAYEPFNIPSGSMVPTLLVGDYLFVSKFSYGYSKFSLPFAPPLFSGRILENKPQRGDVFVFKKPTNTKIDYIKRLIGMPGETIQIVNGLVLIDGKPVVRKKILGLEKMDAFGRKISVPQYLVTLPNGVQHRVIELLGDKGPADNTGIFTVPKGHYFMMGDNRDNSVDSRDKNVGTVPLENLVGRAEILFWAWDPRWSWWEIWNWPKAIRFSRIFDLIQ